MSAARVHVAIDEREPDALDGFGALAVLDLHPVAELAEELGPRLAEAPLQSAGAEFGREALDVGRGASVAISHAKRFAPDAALRAAITCSEVLGAYGWLHDHPLARFIALAKMLQVVDGTSEVQRLVIARSVLKEFETHVA